MKLTELRAGDQITVTHKRAWLHPIGVPLPQVVTFSEVFAGSEVYDDPDETYIAYTYPNGGYETCALYDLASIEYEGEQVEYEYI